MPLPIISLFNTILDMDSQEKPNDSVKIPTIQEVKKQWEGPLSSMYIGFDSMANQFYYTLVNMMDLPKANHILEIGCGRCSLVPYSLGLKNPQTTYLATDLSEKMIEFSHEHLRKLHEMNESKLSYEEWLGKSRLTIEAKNGEQSMNSGHKFDRIIANLVLMLTENPEKMLTSLYEQASQHCLLGISVWGDPDLNQIHTVMNKISASFGVKPPSSRPNSHLFNAVDKLAEKVGWKVKCKWDQISYYPSLDPKSLSQYSYSASRNLKHLSEQQKDEAYNQFMEATTKQLGEGRPLRFPGHLLILEK